MFSIPEQFSAASKANVDAQLAFLTSFTNKAFESVEKVVELNLSTAKASLEESAKASKQLLVARDPQEFFSVTTAKAQPNTEKVAAYSRDLASIATSAQAEFTKAAEAQIAETSRKIIALVDEVSKNAPAGSENVIALVKSAIGNANAGYEQLAKSTKQAVEALEGNLNSTGNQLTQVTEKAASRARK